MVDTTQPITEAKVAAENLSTAELRKLLDQRVQQENAETRKKKAEYEAGREVTIEYLIKKAQELASLKKSFLADAHQRMQKQAVSLKEYGLMRKNSQGGFQLVSNNDKFKVVYRTDKRPYFDERANEAETLLMEFLKDTIKKKDQTVYNIIVSLLARNKNGALEFSRIQKLYQYEESYSDPRWKEALRLLKESFNEGETLMQLNFYERAGVANEFKLIEI